MRKLGIALVVFGVAIALSVPILGPTLVAPRATLGAHELHRGEGVNVVFLAPVANRSDFYGGQVIPIRIDLTDNDDSDVLGANVTVWVNGEPATSIGLPAMGNKMVEIHPGIYQFNLNTKPYPAGPGSQPIDLGILAKVPDDRMFEAHKSISLD